VLWQPDQHYRLKMDEELRSIEEVVHRSQFRQRFQIQTAWITRFTDLSEVLLKYEPNIVHFSGHGAVISQIVLEDSSGNLRSVHPKSLGQIFSLFNSCIRCVMLSGCYSEIQAQAIASIDYVIGTSQALGDCRHKFFAAFYQALSYGRDIKSAFELGRVQIQLEGDSEDTLPVFLNFRKTSSLSELHGS
jgi:hypothetical protein